MNVKFSPSATPIKLYRSPMSGHCHRVELMMSFLDIPYTTVDLDMMNGAHKAPEFLELSPFGQVPAIDDNGTTLSDSNAILVYLVQKYGTDYAWMPTDPVEAAEVQRWLSVAAGEIFAGPCVVRLVKLFGMSFDYEVAKAKTVGLFSMLYQSPQSLTHVFAFQVAAILNLWIYWLSFIGGYYGSSSCNRPAGYDDGRFACGSASGKG